MPRWVNISLWITGAASLIIVGVWVLINAVASDMCANEPFADLPSPDGTLKAIVFRRDCGATTGFSTQVSIIGASESLPNRGGNLFVADTDHGKAPSGIGGGPQVRVTWSGPRSVRVGHHRDARVFLAKPAISGVSAEYVAFQ
jgi:hypothetical protein